MKIKDIIIVIILTLTLKACVGIYKQIVVKVEKDEKQINIKTKNNKNVKDEKHAVN